MLDQIQSVNSTNKDEVLQIRGAFNVIMSCNVNFLKYSTKNRKPI